MQPIHPYGSAFWRFAAFFIDSVIFSIFGTIVDLTLGLPGGITPEALEQQTGLPSLIKLIYYLLYWPLFESSPWQATPGKWICRLYVAGLEGTRLSFGRAFIRHISKALSFATLGFGFLMIAVTIHNQCLHDKIARSVVLRRQKKQKSEAQV